jgi:valyl-tRNA synthetase
MEISKTYHPAEVESKWYQYWLEHKFFKSTPDDREPFTVVIPPPNVTGILHMGHMLNNTIQDILVRRARMQGKNACWVPGTDHASIATEAKVVAMLKEQGIDKKDLTRAEFLQHAWAWKEKYGGIILEQLKKLGCSLDWDRVSFTMDESYSDSVIEAFVQLYQKGYIYRGIRMVNWDPKGKTALSDEEVIFKETNSKLYYIKYQIKAHQPPKGEQNSEIVIATVRPETILGDTAICVNPNDERYKHLIGKKALVPIVNREIPIIADEYVTMDFGTGALKVTPAHDLNDYELGIKHNLPVIDTIADDGTLNENCGVPKFVGKDRFAVRRDIVKDLEALGQIVKIEDYKNQVGTSERTGAVIEPKLSLQWFVKMKEISKPAWDAVMDDTVQLHPPKFKNMYNAWMENVRDWCISRQLWWGHQIPAYYLPNGEIIVAKSKKEAVEIANRNLPDITGFQLAADRGNIPQEDVPVPYTEDDLRQDEDVLDTWASSWLWPIAVFGELGKEDSEDLKYYYPTNDLVTAPEILFFWVARMMIAGYQFRGEAPFKNVYLTGIVRDQFGRKMSKQLGNSPDIFDLMDRYSTDGVRFGILSSSPAGNDLTFDTPVPNPKSTPEEIAAFNANPENLNSKLCETGRRFTNKIWNAFRLLKGWQVSDEPSNQHEVAVEWFDARFQAKLQELEDNFSKYRISEALNTVYKLFWDDFCDWYLEMIKPSPLTPESLTPDPSPKDRGETPSPLERAGLGLLDRATYEVTIEFFEKLLKIIHPFMPFITEEVWQQICERGEGESICIAEYPTAIGADFSVIMEEAETAFELITQIRKNRTAKQISPKTPLKLAIKTLTADKPIFEKYAFYIQKLGNIENITFTDQKVENALNFMVQTHEFFIPIEGEQINVEEEKARLQAELQYAVGFKESVMKKLGNEKFVANAKPEVVEAERKKLADAEAKIQALEAGLGSL